MSFERYVSVRTKSIFATKYILGLHSSSPTSKISEFLMPAMSPTMMEGSISRWKVSEGSKFIQGEVLLEIVRKF
jgi:hypothetical protein